MGEAYCKASVRHEPTGPYGMELVGVERNGIAVEGHFRIHDSQDNAIASCYLRKHAELLVRKLNQR